MSSTPDSQTPADSPGFSRSGSEAKLVSHDDGFSADEFLAELAALDSAPFSSDVVAEAAITGELQAPSHNGTSDRPGGTTPFDSPSDTATFNPANGDTTPDQATDTATFGPATGDTTPDQATDTATFNPATSDNTTPNPVTEGTTTELADATGVLDEATVTNELQAGAIGEPNLGTITSRLDGSNQQPDPDLVDLMAELGIDDQPETLPAVDDGQSGVMVSNQSDGVVSLAEVQPIGNDPGPNTGAGRHQAGGQQTGRPSGARSDAGDDTTLLGFEKRAGDARPARDDSSTTGSEPRASKPESTLFVQQDPKSADRQSSPLSGGRNRASIDRPGSDADGSDGFSTLTMVALGAVAVALIALTVWYFLLRDDKVDGAQVASANTAETPTSDRSSGQTDLAQDGISGLIASAAERPVTISSLRFDPGKTSLTAEATEQAKQIVTFLEANPTATATIEVRNSSEVSASGTTDLAKRQASALRSRFTQAKLGDRVQVRALGSLPPSPAHPAPNFVAVTTGIGQPELSDLLGNKDAFSLGLDETGTNLRPEAVRRLGEVGALLAESPSARITLAGYSYSELTLEDNAKLAAGTVEAVANRLVHTYDLDPDQISAVVAGSAPYEIPATIGGMVTVHLSPNRDARFNLARVDLSTINFAPDTATLQPESAQTLDELAELTAGGSLRLRIDVASYGQDNEAANAQLSAAIADAVTEALSARGLTENQFLVTASGADSHRSAEDLTGPVVVTASFS